MTGRTLKPLNPNDFDTACARHLLARAGFGGMQAQVDALVEMGLSEAVAALVDYDDVPYTVVNAGDFDAAIMFPPSPEQRTRLQNARRNSDELVLEEFRRQRQQRQRTDRAQLARLQEWWLKRLIESPRPLEEKLTLFWHGHFATGYRSIEDSYHMFRQNQLFRHHASGNFKQLAHAIIRDPAMIRYLNNNQNRKAAPNENLARELMELFTLGEGHDYTERDIKEGARALTGYTFDDDEFVFRQGQHDKGEKTILGERGTWDGDDFVNLIFTKRAASEYLCHKLYQYFVNDNSGTPSGPVQQFIVDLATQLRDESFELRPVLTTLFTSQHFYDEANRGTVIKSPVQLVVQAIRTLHTPIRSLRDLLSACDLMGQNLFNPPSVKGWDGGRKWINTSTLFIRQNTLVYLLTGLRPGGRPWEADATPFDVSDLLGPLRDNDGAIDPAAALDQLLTQLLCRPVSAERRRPLSDLLASEGDAWSPRTLIKLLSLICAMPEYQLS